MMEDQGSFASQPPEIVRDLEIESFSAGRKLDIDVCKEVWVEIETTLSLSKTRENEVSKLFKLLQSELLSQDNYFQSIQLKRNEINITLEQLVSERDSLQTKHNEAKKGEMVIKYEYKRVVATNQDLKEQADSVKLLNEDIVQPVLAKKDMEYKIAKEEYLSALKELDKLKSILGGVTQQYADVQSGYDTALGILRQRKLDGSGAKDGPFGLQKEIESMNKKALSMEDELRRSRDELAASQGRLLDVTRTKKGLETLYKEAVRKLEEQTKRCNKSNDEFTSIRKALLLGQTKYHSLTTTRVSIEIKLKEAIEHLRHKKAAALMHRKQLDRMMRLYLKKKSITERDCGIVNTLKLKLIEDTNMVEENQMICSDQYKAIESMKNDVSVKVARLLEQRNIEDVTRNELEAIFEHVEEKENEVDKWGSEVKKLSTMISVLSNQRDIQVKKTKSIINDEKDTKELTKIKTFLVMDMNKVLRETNKRTKEFGALYVALKREKNEVKSSMSASSIALTEIRQRIESDTSLMQSSRCSQEGKKNVLLKEKDSHQNSKCSRAMLRVEKTNTYASFREKLEEMERQKNKIDRQKSVIGSQQRDILQLKARNSFLKERSRLISDQMSQKKGEFHSLLQRANIHEEILKRGELAIEQKKEDIRVLQIQCADTERYISAKKTIQGSIKARREMILDLKGRLKTEKRQIATLSECLENPGKESARSRWRDLGGEDLDEEQLFAKKEILMQRLGDGKEQLIEREVLLEELLSQNRILENDVEICRIKSQPTIKKLNECQARVRESTRSMMALVSELSMHQATALNLEENKETKEEQLSNARNLVSQGQPPSELALRELNRKLQKSSQEADEQREQENVDPRSHENEFGKMYYPAKYALRTTAEPRPTAYIPDVGIEVPKPYGVMAAFKPSDRARTLRQIDKPILDEFQ